MKALRPGKPRNLKLVSKVKRSDAARAAARCCGDPKVRCCGHVSR